MSHFQGQKSSRGLLTLSALLFVAAIAPLPGCSPEGEVTRATPASKIVLGVSQIAGSANWDTANARSIREAANEAGVQVLLEDARRSQERQVALLRSFVRQGVNVIAFSPVVETGWEVVLREIRAARIPVILMDRTIEISDDSLYASLVGSDFLEEGRRAGQWLLDNTRELPGDINIVELQGSVGSAPANDRKLGFAEAITADHRYRIIRSQSADFLRDRAREVMASFLKAEGRRIHVVFAHSDTMAFGAIEAIEAAGLKPGGDILVLSTEGSRKGLEAIIAGKINVSVECSPLFGPQLISVVRDLAAGKPVSKRIITVEAVFTRENAATALATRAY